MKEIYSNADDCFELASYLKNKMGDKIDFYGSVYQEVITGKYIFPGTNPNHYYWFESGLPFYYKFCKGKFLRIQVGSFSTGNNSTGEKLAVLSDFYEALSEQFGEPTVFYTTQDDEGVLSMHWSFVNKKEDIQKFKDGTYFDDDSIDKLIVIGEPKTDSYKLSETARRYLAKQIGVPFEMIGLVDENIEDFVKYKTKSKMQNPVESLEQSGIKRS